MPNNNISAPKPDDLPLTGQEYNALRQDLLNNHRHSGPNDGGPLSHRNLEDIGKYDHPQVDAHIDATGGVHGLDPAARVVGGRANEYQYEYREFPNQEPHHEIRMSSGAPVELRAGVVDWPTYHFNWGLNQTYPTRIEFSPPFPEGCHPVVTVTLCKNMDPQAPLAIPVIYDMERGYFTVRFIAVGDVPADSLKFNWVAVGITPGPAYSEWME